MSEKQKMFETYDFGFIIQLGMIEVCSDEETKRRKMIAYAQKDLIEKNRNHYYSNRWYGGQTYNERIMRLERDYYVLQQQINNIKKGEI